MRSNRLLVITALLVAASSGVLLTRTHSSVRSPASMPKPHFPELSENTTAKAQLEWMKLHDPSTGIVPSGIRAREIAFANSLPRAASSSFKSSQAFEELSASDGWVSNGPWNVGGRTQEIAVDVANEQVLLAASAQGGVWRSPDQGNTWSIATRPDQLHDAMSLAQDTRFGKRNIWYCGTGELLSTTWRRVSEVYAPRWRTTDIGNGIFKSTDSGKSWNPIPSTQTNQLTTLDQPFDGVWKIVLDPNANGEDIVYAACYGAIMRSADGGTSWTHVLGDQQNPSFCSDVVISSTGVLYAAMSTYTLTGTTSGAAGIWRSTDGIAWNRISGNAVGWPGASRRMRLALAPSNENLLYLLMETPGFGTSGHSLWVYNFLSGDGSGSGGKWQDRSINIPFDSTNPNGTASFNSLGGYALIIKVKPGHENTVFIGGTNIHRSTDGFATPTNVKWLGGYSDGIHDFRDHPDYHAITFLPSNPRTMFVGNDGGVFVTRDDDTPDTVAWASLNHGYVSTMFYSISMDRKASGDQVLVGGLQDNYSWAGWDQTSDWTNLGGGDGCYSAVSDNKEHVYVASQFASIVRYDLDQAQNVISWSYVPPYDTSYVFVSPYLLDPTNTDRMYLAGGHSIWRIDDLTLIPDNNNNWVNDFWYQMPTTQITDGSVIGCIAASTVPANRIYYGTSNGSIYRLDDADVADPVRKDITSSLFPKGGFVGCVAIDPHDANAIIAVFSNYGVRSLFSSSDGGTTWHDISGNLEQHPDGSGDGPSCRWARIVHFGLKTTYYVATSTGLYSTDDISAASPIWVQEGPNTIGNIGVEMIDSRETDGLVAIATEGRGVFTTTAPNGVASLDRPINSDALFAPYPNPADRNTTISISLSASENISIDLFDEAGRKIRTLLAGTLSRGHRELSIDLNGLSQGSYFVKMQTSNGLTVQRLIVRR